MHVDGLDYGQLMLGTTGGCVADSNQKVTNRENRMGLITVADNR